MSKGEFKSYLKRFVNPEFDVKESDWTRAYNFYLGYNQCFKDAFKFPVEDSYAQGFILSECFKFLKKIINE